MISSMDERLNARIRELKIVPVIKLDRVADALPLGKALLEGGLPIAEITFRTDAAEESIRALTSRLPEVLVGAGTVLTVDQVQRAQRAGARFVVTPGFNPTVVDYCVKNRIPIYPGINNPMGVEAALERGLTVLKFFPAEVSGGIKMIQALAGPYVGVRYVPTGGVTPANLAAYLKEPAVYAVGGTWIAKADLISAGKFDEIAKLTREAVAIACAQ